MRQSSWLIRLHSNAVGFRKCTPDYQACFALGREPPRWTTERLLGAHRVKHLASMAARTRPLVSCAPGRVGADLARAAPGVGPTASCAVEVATGCLIRCRVRMFTLP